MNNCEVCLSHYLSALALSWDVVLNITTLDIEPISDADICLFFGKGMRSGFSYISKRHSKLKKRYLKSYDPKQESNHITYLETNNLYDYAMLKILPTSGFK